MNPINMLLGINLFVTVSANWSGAKKGLKTSLTKVKKRPKTYLQKLPPNISALILLLMILGIFKIGVYTNGYSDKYFEIRLIGLILYFIFSWLQVFAFKSMGESYAQEVLILKEHKLNTNGIYSRIRHPQYLSQIISDLAAGIALMSYLIVPLVLIVELPLFILRASLEEELLENEFGEKYRNYRKRSGFFIPFIG